MEKDGPPSSFAGETMLSVVPNPSTQQMLFLFSV